MKYRNISTLFLTSIPLSPPYSITHPNALSLSTLTWHSFSPVLKYQVSCSFQHWQQLQQQQLHQVSSTKTKQVCHTKLWLWWWRRRRCTLCLLIFFQCDQMATFLKNIVVIYNAKHLPISIKYAKVD